MFVSAPDGPRGLAAVVKRAVDLVGALVLVVLTAPLMLTIAALIVLDSPGPPLIRQERVGRGMRLFRMYKFRSMLRESDKLRTQLLDMNELDGPLFKIRRDPRLTRVGARIRRWSIDELPQLLNVVRGEMSLVGPRPPFDHEVEQDYLRQAIRLRYPPGMTGLWQVSGRSDLAYDEMMRLDLSYTRDWSIELDVRILLRTVPVVLSGKGAY